MGLETLSSKVIGAKEVGTWEEGKLKRQAPELIKNGMGLPSTVKVPRVQCLSYSRGLQSL